MLIFSPIQSTLNSPSRKFVFDRIISIVNRYLITVVKTSTRSIIFFLFCVFNSISRTKSFKFSSQLPKGDLDKILIIRPSDIDFLLDAWIVSNYQFTYLMFQAMVDYYLCCFVQIISNAVVTPLIESCLSSCKRLNSLFVLKRGQISVLLVVPLINAFKSLAINQKLMPISIGTSAQVINPQIQSYSALRIYRCF